jgi:hypothetical protein
MRVQCAWCDTPIPSPTRARTAPASARVSDGICPTCLSQQLAALARQAAAPGVLRTASALR